ncbi:MAG: hypothetical protein A3A88_00875 [Nitrospirae bacterium RIFCSPLOWO2_01_FULL_62_17]|nr:MAG: hypothetical protein A3A88_00875 [Nitrospirae bacterium RIFCSPLOWO2_01_FULL_62_17]
MITRRLVLFIALAVAWVPGNPVFAGYGDGPGCGLGADLFKDGKKSIMHQSVASTTNQLASQSLAITSQTWNCTNNGRFTKIEEATVFASLTFKNLSQEMAQGGGEHLASLATILGVPAEQQPEFFSMTQEKYTTLVQSDETTPAAMLKALQEAMAAHQMLAQAR